MDWVGLGSYHESQEKIMKMFIGKNCNSTKKTWQSLLFLYGPLLRDTLTYATLRKGKSWTQECLGKPWRVQRLFFPLTCQDWGKLWTFEASKKLFWRMEAKNIKALQVLLKCDFWTSKKSWKPPLTFMEEWYVGILRYIRLLEKKPFQTNVQQQNSWIFIFERMVLK